MCKYLYESCENGTGYKIDYRTRMLETYHQGIVCQIPFEKAFSHAIECTLHVEQGLLPNVRQQLFLAVYKKYIEWAPCDLRHPDL